MAYNRIHIEGTLASGAEEWSTSFAVATPTGTAESSTPELTTWADDCLLAFTPGTGWPGDMRSLLGVTSQITKIRIYYYPTVASAAAAMGESSGAAVSGSGSAQLPLQSSLVYSLLTPIPGRSFRGRMYWPWLTGLVQSNGKINTSSITLASRASSFKDMLLALTNAGTFAGLEPVIVSKARNTMTTVSQVRVGDVVDTQRRRRDNLVEAFGSAAV